MGFGKIIKRAYAFGFKRKNVKNLRRKFGITSDSKLVRKIKKSLSGKSVVAGAPTSASALDANYQYRPRTISQLMGGS